MCRLTSADKGRTDAAASFRHGRKKQTGVAQTAAWSRRRFSVYFQTLPRLAVDFSPTNKHTNKLPRFQQVPPPLIMLRTFSLSPSVSSAALRS